MLKFSAILELIKECDKTITADKLIRALPLVGILIRGNWIAQSEILYPVETLSNSNGVSADLMIRARDYIVSICPEEISPINIFPADLQILKATASSSKANHKCHSVATR